MCNLSSSMPYSLKKTLRFKLKPISAPLLEEQSKNLTSENQELGECYNALSKMHRALSEFICKFSKFIQISEDDSKYHPIIIKSSWIKNFFKEQYYAGSSGSNNNKGKKISLFLKDEAGEPFILNALNIWQDDCNQFIKEINLHIEQWKKVKENLTRKSEIALEILAPMSQRNWFMFMKSFLDVAEYKDKQEDQRQSDAIETFRTFTSSFSAVKERFLPSQSSGIVLARASFNYYTILKDFKSENKADTYISKKKSIDECLKELDKFFINIKKKRKLGNEIKLNQTLLKKYFELLKKENYLLVDILDVLKKIKSEQKSAYYSLFDHDASLSDAIKIELFSDVTKEQFDQFKEKTRAIKGKANLINQLSEKEEEKEKLIKLKEEITQLKKERGNPLFDGKKSNEYLTYKLFCELIKGYAVRYGNKKAKLLALEKEKYESSLLEYWAVMTHVQEPTTQGNQNIRDYIALIPKFKLNKSNNNPAQSAYSEFKSSDASKEKLNHSISIFESLTIRSLEKLCFKSQKSLVDSFKDKVFEELDKERSSVHKKSRDNKHITCIQDLKHITCIQDLKPINNKPMNNEQELVYNDRRIEFYSSVLRSNYAKKVLSLPNEELKTFLDKNFNANYDAFCSELENICYIRKVSTKHLDINNYLIDKFSAQIFLIDNMDFRKSMPSNLKKHTTIWNRFWNDNLDYNVRINPQIAIMWRDSKPSRVKKYGEKSSHYDATGYKHNRFLTPQYTLITTVTENANKKQRQVAFRTPQERASDLEGINKEVNKKLNEETVYFGIDSGEACFESLYAVRFDSPEQPCPFKFDAWEIKDLTNTKKITTKKGEEKIIYIKRNPSYFMEDEDEIESFFEKKERTCLDLTKAKLIKGKIVINADFKTFEQLSIKSFEKKCVEAIQNSEISIETVIDEIKKLSSEIMIRIKTNKETNTFIQFYLPDSLKDSSEDVKKELINYFEKYRNEKRLKHLEREKINHLREALTANMVGIIAHLYQKVDQNALICLENLRKENIASKQEKSYRRTERLFEYALIKKMQNLFAVPPDLTEAIFIRELETERSEHYNQFGKLIFVPEEKTSTNCPRCDGELKGCSPKGNRSKKGAKCKSCDFEMENGKPNAPFEFQKADDIAAFNIAKRGYERTKNSL